MAKHDSHLQDVLNAPEGPHIAALFDFDGTIIAGYSATAILKEKIKRREMTAEEVVETANVMAQYAMGNMGFSGLMTGAAKFMKGVTEDSYFEFGEELYEKHIARKVYPEARDLIEAHRAKGHTIAIISSATIYQIEPTARDLDIEHVLCSQYEVENGEFTGNIIRPLCFGEGKVLAAEELAKTYKLNLDRSYFYSDSYDDIELLERVGKPRPLNPNGKLREVAMERGWPLQQFDSRGQGKPVDYLRTIYATGSLVGAAVASLPIWGLTGSQREAMNFSTGLFGDIATALTGCELEVTGEENLWTARPCIFVFNHQSKADVMILAKLIRKDMGGVGKKEIRDTPIIGKLMELAGTVFIDRADGRSAIKAMEPLIEAIQVDRKSIVIAPEGTRTLSPKLGPFKKGAFHMAMQAGVPMVPIVIHNAGDIAPKNEFLMRPARVRVEVLPPVDTSDWSVKSINEHVAEVRGMFLKALGQDTEEEALEALVSGGAGANVKDSKSRRSTKAPKRTAGTKVVSKRKPVAIQKSGVEKTEVRKPVTRKVAPKKPAAVKASVTKNTVAKKRVTRRAAKSTSNSSARTATAKPVPRKLTQAEPATKTRSKKAAATASAKK
ncbi:HAD-IB family hydrolase [Parasphingorhabdus halotolerans]|uniref:1-acyl-sn-glycerol-3-phosphate acyltransferase n=1 Tax=Parasphingorhabdus halotolerans TaxID=2725558 RepID=A0A6H2DIS7_9SPHN|nr:HAD-IB family hydrolase [Parasphingorhabdus halotolerans]QJB68047.1 HAD-IB family hydrolase [Parasphingorhabdus halotolerans]